MDNLSVMELENRIANEISKNADRIYEQIKVAYECIGAFIDTISDEKNAVTKQLEALRTLDDFIRIARTLADEADAENKALVKLENTINPHE